MEREHGLQPEVPGRREHDLNGVDCWCEPVLTFDGPDGQVWVHLEADGERPPQAAIDYAIASLTVPEEAFQERHFR